MYLLVKDGTIIGGYTSVKSLYETMIKDDQSPKSLRYKGPNLEVKPLTQTTLKSILKNQRNMVKVYKERALKKDENAPCKYRIWDLTPNKRFRLKKYK